MNFEVSALGNTADQPGLDRCTGPIEPMTVRDAQAKNLAEALDFSKRRDPVNLPDVPKPDVHACDNPDHVG